MHREYNKKPSRCVLGFCKNLLLITSNTFPIRNSWLDNTYYYHNPIRTHYKQNSHNCLYSNYYMDHTQHIHSFHSLNMDNTMYSMDKNTYYNNCYSHKDMRYHTQSHSLH